MGIDVDDGPAIRDHVGVQPIRTAKTPLLAQDLLQQGRAGTGRLAVDPVVGAHDRDRSTLLDAGLKGRQIRIPLDTFINDCVKMVPIQLRAAVDGIVLGCGDQLQVDRIIALQAFDKHHAHLGGEVGIFAVGLLSPSPSWIAKDVNIG